MTVTALLVSHDGVRWLPAVLGGLAQQTRAPERIVVVDTGSTDGSHEVLRSGLGADDVVAAGDVSFPAAVAAGLEHVARTSQAGTSEEEPDWVWLLHDDSAPAPGALEALLDAARENRSVSILGPKLREWPSLRHLLEIGVTISGTGHRETGLERGEYDQGQHDHRRQVLAVNTAGMLVKRSVLVELGGFDPRLPLFGNDIDFGWRAARAGHRCLVVPESVVFHVEAAQHGVRRTRLSGRRPHRSQRRAALYTLLVGCSALALPVQAVRLLLGSLVRALGFLLVRAPRESWDELAALAATYARADRIVAGRLRRRRTARVRPGQVRHLLPPVWLPYRHGLDFVADLMLAVVHQAGDLSARRAARSGPSEGGAPETGPVPAEAQNLPADTGVLARLVGSPAALTFAVLCLAALVCARGLYGPGSLSGGALLPAPSSALDWWRLYLESWHHVGVGSAAATAPYVLPLAVLGTILLAKAWLLIDLLFFFVVPLAAFGAYRLLLELTGARLPSVWGAVAYGLVPVLCGAVGQGRLGTVAAAVILPWAGKSALRLSLGFSTDRRWRAAWRTALLLALLAAFAPLGWFIAVAVALVGVVSGLVRSPRAWSRPSAWGPVLACCAAVPVLLLPWSWQATVHDGLVAWLFEAGLPAPGITVSPSAAALALGRVGDLAAAPGWLSAGVVAAAVAALARRDTRAKVLPAWAVLVVALGAMALLAGHQFAARGHVTAQPEWWGLPLLVASGAAVCAATVSGTDIVSRISGASFGWRQPLGVLVVVAALLSPVAGLVWWLVTGIQGPLDRSATDPVPTYMNEAAQSSPTHGVLLIEGSRADGFQYRVLRGDGFRLGDDSVLPTVQADRPMTRLVGDLATGPDPSDVTALARHGVRFIYLPPPADPRLAGNLDSLSGLNFASAVRRGSRAWQVEAAPSAAALATPSGSWRPLLLGVEALALLAVAVLAVPSRRQRR